MSTYPRQEKQGFFNGPPLLCVLRFSQEVPSPPVPKTHLSAVLVIGRACDGKKKVTESIHKIAVGCKYRFHRQCGWLGWQSFSCFSCFLCHFSEDQKNVKWRLFIKMATDWQVSEVGDTFVWSEVTAISANRANFCKNCASRVSRALECPPLAFARNKDEKTPLIRKKKEKKLSLSFQQAQILSTKFILLFSLIL